MACGTLLEHFSLMLVQLPLAAGEASFARRELLEAFQAGL
jgi:hypothetical protein